MNLSWSIPLILSLAGQSAPAERAPKEDAPERLAFMKQSLEAHEVGRGGDPSVTYRLDREPVMRFTNSVGDVRDGAIFLWRDAAGRPTAAVQVFWHQNNRWYQEYSSLSTKPITADHTWNVGRAGITFRPIPDAPRPAETTEQRLRQMRELAGEFSAEQQLDQRPWDKLRLLTKPLARYGKPGDEPSDGALFAFVLTTDPEVYLMIEARKGSDGEEWQYALAPASVAPLVARLGKTEVWSLPFREAWTDNSAPYYVHYFHTGSAKASRVGTN